MFWDFGFSAGLHWSLHRTPPHSAHTDPGDCGRTHAAAAVPARDVHVADSARAAVRSAHADNRERDSISTQLCPTALQSAYTYTDDLSAAGRAGNAEGAEQGAEGAEGAEGAAWLL